MTTTDRPQFRVFAEAPTVYQSNSVRFFGLTVRGRNGLLTFDFFNTEQDAINYLLSCVDYYAERNGSEEELNELREDCKMGFLSYDAVTAKIETAEYHSGDNEDVTWS